jgi:hypothetical protein
MCDRACHPLVQRQLGWSGFNVAFGQWLIRVQLLAEIGSPAQVALLTENRDNDPLGDADSDRTVERVMLAYNRCS